MQPVLSRSKQSSGRWAGGASAVAMSALTKLGKAGYVGGLMYKTAAQAYVCVHAHLCTDNKE